MKELIFPQVLVMVLQALGIASAVVFFGAGMNGALAIAVAISAFFALAVFRFEAYHYEESEYAAGAHAMGTTAVMMTFFVFGRGYVDMGLGVGGQYALLAVMWAATVAFGAIASRKAIERGAVERPLLLALVAQPFVGPVIAFSAHGLKRADPRTRESIRTIAFTVVALFVLSGSVTGIVLLSQ